jgi:hypothetical protein
MSLLWGGKEVPTLCPACGGHDLNVHGDVLQCHDCGHVVVAEVKDIEKVA